jgi:hypothetical protein
MVFGSTMLEIAIGMIFVYLLMSLLCSALLEFIESLFKFRAKDLEHGIVKLLGSPELAQSFFNHPMIKPLFEGRKPSYIPARTFSLALWNMATAAAERTPAAVAGVAKDVKLMRSTITTLSPNVLPDNLRASLVSLIDEAGGDFDKARANVEAWYNDSMDRVSGRFKRRTQWFLIVIGLILSFLLNVDSINIVKVLSHNEELRATVVAAAETYAKEPLPGTTPTPTPAPTPTPSQPAAASATPTPKTAGEQFTEASERINNIRGKLDELGLPVGWVFAPNKADAKYYKGDEKKFDQALYDSDLNGYVTDPRRIPDWGSVPMKFLGLLLTAFAVSQGAPFWFDMLNKIIVIRSTVKPHEKSRDEGTKDKSAKEDEKDDAV